MSYPQQPGPVPAQQGRPAVVDQWTRPLPQAAGRPKGLGVVAGILAAALVAATALVGTSLWLMRSGGSAGRDEPAAARSPGVSDPGASSPSTKDPAESGTPTVLPKNPPGWRYVSVVNGGATVGVPPTWRPLATLKPYSPAPVTGGARVAMTPLMTFGPQAKPSIWVGLTDSDNRITADETSRAVVNRWQDSLAGKQAKRPYRLPDAARLADGSSAALHMGYLMRRNTTIGAVSAVSYRVRGRFKTLVIYAPVVNDDYVGQTRVIDQIISTLKPI